MICVLEQLQAELDAKSSERDADTQQRVQLNEGKEKETEAVRKKYRKQISAPLR